MQILTQNGEELVYPIHMVEADVSRRNRTKVLEKKGTGSGQSISASGHKSTVAKGFLIQKKRLARQRSRRLLKAAVQTATKQEEEEERVSYLHALIDLHI